MSPSFTFEMIRSGAGTPDPWIFPRFTVPRVAHCNGGA